MSNPDEAQSGKVMLTKNFENRLVFECDGSPARLTTDGAWLYVESKEDGQWRGGLAGTQEWLGLTDEQASWAYPKK